MRLIKTLAASALIASTIGGAAFAGGFAAEVIEAPVVIVEPVVVRSSWGIILPIAAVVLLIALASADNS